MENHVTCLGCGYDLRGLSETGGCPECGHDMAESRAAPQQNVSRRELATMLIRLMVIWTVLGLMWYVIQLGRLVVSMAGGRGYDMDSAGQAAGMVLFLSAAGGVWYWAPAIAGRLVARDGRAFSGPLLGPTVVWRIGCMLLGLYFAVTGFTGFIGGLVALPLIEDQYWMYVWPSLPVQLLQGLLGVALLLGAPWFVRLIRRARSFGVK